jgi:transposase
MAIALPDARQLTDEVLEALRLRALRGCELGFTEADVADFLGVARETVSRWWTAYTTGGLESVPQDRTGRPVGSGRTLDDSQAQHLQQKIDNHGPEEWGIASPLWTRRAVRDLIHQEYGLWMPVRTVGQYLQRWGYTPKKPRKKAKKQDPKEVQQWLENTYPAIEEAARQQDAEIHWCDEKGVQANEHEGKGYARVGQTPEIQVSAKRFPMNLISAIGKDGKVRFMTYSQTMTAALFVVFLTRLIQGAKKKIFLIVDPLPAHMAGEVKEWLRERSEKIELFSLPPRAPELNPVESLNNDVHSGVNATKLPDTQKELRSNLQRFMHHLAKLPEHIISYFANPYIQYAAPGIM